MVSIIKHYQTSVYCCWSFVFSCSEKVPKFLGFRPICAMLPRPRAPRPPLISFPMLMFCNHFQMSPSRNRTESESSSGLIRSDCINRCLIHASSEDSACITNQLEKLASTNAQNLTDIIQH